MYFLFHFSKSKEGSASISLLQKRDQISRCGLNIRNNINGSNLLQKIVVPPEEKKIIIC